MRTEILGKPAFHLILITVLGILIYSNTFDVPFIFDDELNIVENHYIRDLSNFLDKPSREGVSPSTYDLLERRIAGYFTFALNYKAHGLEVWSYHTVNLAIHILTALLVYILVRLTLRTPFMVSSTLKDQAGYVALFSGLLFVCHPVQTQAVTYIVQRFTSLATMFYLLCVVLYARWRIESTVLDSGFGVRRRCGYIYLLSLLSCVLAMITKETAFTLPLAVLVYEIMFFKGKIKWRLLYLAPLFLTMLIIPLKIVDAGKSLGEIIGEAGEKTRLITEMSRQEYMFTELRVVTDYVRLLFLPVNQNIDYDYPLYRSFFELPVFLSFLFLLSILICGIYFYYRSRITDHSSELGVRSFTVHPSRLIAFGVFWFFLTLSVESSVIPIVDVIFEHRIYLPSAGAFIAIVSGAYFLFQRLEKGGKKAALAVFIGMLLVLSTATYARNTIWKSEVNLWEDVVSKSPNKARPHNNLGAVYLVDGKIDAALEQLKITLRLEPDYKDAHINIGSVYKAKGRMEDAIEHYRAAMKSDPNSANIYVILGSTYLAKGDVDKAVEYLEIALRLKPKNLVIAHNNLAAAYQSKGLFEKAVEHYRSVAELEPRNSASYFNLGNLYQSKGLFDNAIQLYQIALKVDPDYVVAHSNLGVAYQSKGLFDKAIEHYRTALELDPADAQIHFNLGLIYFQKGLMEEAREEFEAALRIDPGYDKARESLERINEKQ